MLSIRKFETNAPGAISPDPSYYVRMADLALLCGSRAEAEALVTLAYLAFDQRLASCDEVTNWRRVRPEKSS
jgi:hypothetical protein